MDEDSKQVNFTDALSKLRKRSTSGQTLNKLIQSARDEAQKDVQSKVDAQAGIRKVKRFQLALEKAGHNALAANIRSCTAKKRCGSTYCPICRQRLASALVKRTYKNIVGTFGGKESSLRDQVRHVTGLVDITSLDASDISNAILTARKNFEDAASRRPWLKIEGAFELELLRFDHMDKMDARYSPRKRETLEAMMKSTLIRPMYGDTDSVVLVHWHALISGLEVVSNWQTRGKPKRKTALSMMKPMYDKHRLQLYVQPLRDKPAKKPLSHHISKISSYPFKDAYRLKYTFSGSSMRTENG